MIRGYLDAGGPLVALRTSCHAFALRDGIASPGFVQWPAFDREVLGCNYHDHDTGPSEISVVPDAKDDPILSGVEPQPWTTHSTKYFTSPVDSRATILLTASSHGESEPAAWTRMYKKSRVFYTSLGHPDDFATPQFRRLLVNAIFWAMNRGQGHASGG